jgi:hypothetical protein
MVNLVLRETPRDAGGLYDYANPIIQSWMGVPTKGVALQQTQVNEPTLYAVDAANLDTTGSPNRRAFRASAGATILRVDSDGIIATSLTVTGPLTVNALTVTTSATIGTTLHVTGAVTFASTLSAGATTLGATSVTTLVVSLTLGVTGVSTLSGTVNANAINGTTITGTGLVSSGTLSVASTSTLAAVNAGAVSGTTGTFSGTLSAAGTTVTTLTASSTVQGTRLISTVATGTAPLDVTSTTVVANLNASAVNGKSWHSPQEAAISSAYTLTTSFADVGGMSITLLDAGKHLILVQGEWSFSPAGSDAGAVLDGRIVADGSAIATTSPSFQVSSVASTGVFAPFFVVGTYTAASASKVVKFQAKKDSGTGSSQLDADSKIVAIWLAP